VGPFVCRSPITSQDRSLMTEMLDRLRRAVADLAAEDRPHFKRIDVSPARPDDGSWLTRRS
jgi:hypothetical protein